MYTALRLLSSLAACSVQLAPSLSMSSRRARITPDSEGNACEPMD